jgi:hypothetical protein
MADIFVSYAREDRETIQHLARLLERCGWTVWWDRHILAGKEFDNVLQEELDRARCVLVAWSSASVTSRWVKAEAGEGLRREILIPIRLDGSLPPLGFRNIQTVFFAALPLDRESSAFGELVEALTALLGGPARPQPPQGRTNTRDTTDETPPSTPAETPREILATPAAAPRWWVALAIAVVAAVFALGLATYTRTIGRQPISPRQARDGGDAPAPAAHALKPAPPPQAAPSGVTGNTAPAASGGDKTAPKSSDPAPSDAVPDKAIHDFVEDLLVASSSGDPNRLLPFYGDRVDYFKMGVVGSDVILKDREAYYRRWPEIKLRLDGDVSVYAGDTSTTKVVKYICHYDVRSPARKVHATGATEATLVISTAGSALKIIGQTEAVKSAKR